MSCPLWSSPVERAQRPAGRTGFCRMSLNGTSRSIWGSLGRPSTRSPMVLRWISLVPPAIAVMGENDDAYASAPPPGSAGSQAWEPGPAKAMPRLDDWRARIAVASFHRAFGPHLHTGGDLVAHLLAHVGEDALGDDELHQLLADDPVAAQAALAGQLDELARVGSGPAGAAAACAGSRPEGQSLVGEHGRERPPPVVLAPDEGRRRDAHVVEEHLVEMGLAGHLTQRPDGDTGRAEGDDEHRQALVLGPHRVGPGDAEGVVRLLRRRRPHLLAAQDVLLAVARRLGLEAGEIRPCPRLGEQLGPHLLAPDHAGDVTALLLLGAEVEQGGGADACRDRLADRGQGVSGGLLVEHLLVLAGQALSPVGRLQRDPQQAGVEEGAAKGARRGAVRGVEGVVLLGVVLQPGLHPSPEVFELYQIVLLASASDSESIPTTVVTLDI